MISTHILQEVEAIADRVLFVNDGRLVFDGTPDGLKQGGSLEEPFYRMTHTPNSAEPVAEVEPTEVPD